jgi:hypothetical protein
VSGEAIVREVVGLGRALREAGLEVGPGRLADSLRGLDAVDLTRRSDVYWALRTTLVSRYEEIDAFERVFRSWPLAASEQQPTAPEKEVEGAMGGEAVDAGHGSDVVEEGRPAPGFSAEELLRQRDFADMSPEELEHARKLVAAIAVERPRRRSRRLRRDPRRGSSFDLRGLVRASLATGGDPVERPFRRRTESLRKLVLLLDVSGSMEQYARSLLVFAHAIRGSGSRVEVFSFGTRLTRLTAELSVRDPAAALSAAADRVVDWSGGTRIGESLKTYNDLWGRRGLTRGAVVIILSDGWERDDAELVGREMARLQRQAYSVVWVNPLKGRPQYLPLAGGMRAALPHVDRFVSGHDVASLELLAVVLGQIGRRHAA